MQLVGIHVYDRSCLWPVTIEL